MLKNCEQRISELNIYSRPKVVRTARKPVQNRTLNVKFVEYETKYSKWTATPDPTKVKQQT